MSLTAYETDQFSNRLVVVRDAIEPTDRMVNQEIKEIAAEWSGPANSRAFAQAIYERLGGRHWVDRIERWAEKSDEVERYPQKRYDNIYRGMPVWATGAVFFTGVGQSFRLNDSMIGTDKLGHFFSQGLKYYKRHLRGWSHEAIIRRGSLTERFGFGYAHTGVYSNADLVANYEGMLFYRSLFEDGVAPHLPIQAILRWEGNQPVQQRPFTWRDHVNDYWDEALNPSYVNTPIRKRLLKKIAALCDDYATQPTRYLPRNEEALIVRYADIGIRPMLELRFDQVCAEKTNKE